MARIYVSSTFSDLQEYREQVRTALRSMHHDDRAMEYYGTADERPIDKCLRDVEECELYIGIFTLRYGFVPPGHDCSITELEYRMALDKGIPRLIFLAAEATWPFSQAEIAALPKVIALCEELKRERTVAFFHSPDDLRAKVYQAVINRHQWVRLQVIAGASKERGIAKIPVGPEFPYHGKHRTLKALAHAAIRS